jgi:hypothetical protein
MDDSGKSMDIEAEEVSIADLNFGKARIEKYWTLVAKMGASILPYATPCIPFPLTVHVLINHKELSRYQELPAAFSLWDAATSFGLVSGSPVWVYFGASAEGLALAQSFRADGQGPTRFNKLRKRPNPELRSTLTPEDSVVWGTVLPSDLSMSSLVILLAQNILEVPPSNVLKLLVKPSTGTGAANDPKEMFKTLTLKMGAVATTTGQMAARKRAKEHLDRRARAAKLALEKEREAQRVHAERKKTREDERAVRHKEDGALTIHGRKKKVPAKVNAEPKLPVPPKRSSWNEDEYLLVDGA